MEVALSFGWMILVFWLILRAHGQRGLLPVLHPAAAALRDPPNISVIVPARNEGHNLPRCLDCLLQQDYPADRLNIIVVDDDSTDDTLVVGTSFARKSRQLKVIECPPLPPRWCGKPHACWIGARMSRPDDEWLCFIDADVQAERRLITSATAAARSQQLALLSLAPRQRLDSFAERLIIPCGLFLMAFYQDLGTVQSPQSDQVTANGQFMLVRREAYESVGGHAAVYNAICEDLELALLIKKAGGHVILQDGSFLLAARMYTGWSSLWTGLSKNIVEMLGGRAATLITALLVLLLSLASILLPAVDSVRCADGLSEYCVALVPALAGTAAATGLHIAGALYFRIPLWYGMMFPLGYAVGACLALESLRRYWRGKIIWKGRRYP
jgi:chlorobactene glucosyltransferase